MEGGSVRFEWDAVALFGAARKEGFLAEHESEDWFGKKRRMVDSEGGRVRRETTPRVAAERINMKVTGIMPSMRSSSTPGAFGAIISRQKSTSQLMAATSTVANTRGNKAANPEEDPNQVFHVEKGSGIGKGGCKVGVWRNAKLARNALRLSRLAQPSFFALDGSK